MMRPIILKVSLFRDHGDDPLEHIRSRVSMLYLLHWLVQHDRGWLRQYPNTPSIYNSKVKYEYKDEVDAPCWQDISYCIAKGSGDCKDFAAWRCAELLEQGVDCRPQIQWRRVDGTYRFHALVVYPDGTTEDPSRALGMEGTTAFITPPQEDDETMDAFKTAECVVKGLILGDEDTKSRAKDSYSKLCGMSDKDPECAKICAMVNRACAQIRQVMGRAGDVDIDDATLEGIVDRAMRPRSRSVFESARGDLSSTDQGLISTGAGTLLSLIPIFGPALAQVTPAVVKDADKLISQAQNGDKAALGKIADTKAKADQGDPQAKQDMATLKAVKASKDAIDDSLLKNWAKQSWNPLSLYRMAVDPTLH